ncbi:hypothetical protein GT347_02760 [Xylophilus rhododendri]|uniref:Uncharacterized protein n=1 Tax=Xylophilus rhododendri TaxID=2697032 RepID=A0A857IZG8_9BURK|nr:hypothetical protein [Xylophilus rhododendri]QHI97000.1 hypothetical protein GT347_02760 [Xylophilus rhododendri]
MDDVFVAIGAAMAEMQGRTLDKIGAAAEAAIRATSTGFDRAAGLGEIRWRLSGRCSGSIGWRWDLLCMGC